MELELTLDAVWKKWIGDKWEPTEIQRELIPALVADRDTVGSAPTGSGKTLAYLLPALERIDPAKKKELQVLILTPTRELALQVNEVAASLLSGSDPLHSMAVVGGVDVKRQVERLRSHPQIIVGTPGRILELLNLRKLSMHYVSLLIVDEIDQVLQLGSQNDVQNLIKRALRDCQLAFVSASVSQEARNFAASVMKDPEFVNAAAEMDQQAKMSHISILIQADDRIDGIRRLIRNDHAKSVMIFVNHSNQVPYLVNQLAERGFTVDGIHGESSKLYREQAMKRFRSGQSQILVTTDLAARGLDVESVTHVLHYGTPLNADQYLHRAGRTGRVGQSAPGKSVLFITRDELPTFSRLEKETGLKFEFGQFKRGQLQIGKTSAAGTAMRASRSSSHKGKKGIGGSNLK